MKLMLNEFLYHSHCSLLAQLYFIGLAVLLYVVVVVGDFLIVI